MDLSHANFDKLCVRLEDLSELVRVQQQLIVYLSKDVQQVGSGLNVLKQDIKNTCVSESKH